MASTYLKVIILGAPVAGKGKISNKIAQTFNLQHIVSGEILLKNTLKTNALGKEIQAYIQNLQLVPDHIVTPVIITEITKYNSWLLDGYPRTVNQAEVLKDNYKPDLVLNVVVPSEQFFKSIRATSNVYRKESIGYLNKEQKEQYDKVLHHKLKAMKHYKKIIRPVVHYYEKTELLKSFSGHNNEEIWEKIKKEIERYLKRK